MIINNQLKLIITIDDDDATNCYHQVVINSSNCCEKLVSYSDGESVLQFLSNIDDETTSPDLIFLDINMPKMDGWEFLDEWSNRGLQKKHPNTKIVVLTTSFNPNDEVRARSHEAVVDFIQKILSAEDLKKILKKCLIK